MAPDTITPEFVADLLRLASTEARTMFLHGSGLLNAEGLGEVLEFAGDVVRSDPGQASQLAALCVEVAEAGDALYIVPPAMYLRAQTHAINGEFSQAGDLIRSAQGLYLSMGQPGAALRTNVGLISVLAEEGQYQEAIAVGRSTLETIERNDQHGMPPLDARRLSALIQKNLGLCYELIGDYVQALHALAQAESLFQETGMDEESAALTMSRGSILLHLGRGVDSVSALQEAATVFSNMGNPLRQARCLNNLGTAHLLLGNYGQSLQSLDEARRLLSSLDARADGLILQGLTADVYLVLNLYQEAVAEYRAANEGLKETGMAYQRAWVLWGMGAALTAQSQWEAADAALSEAAALFREAGNNHLLSCVLLEQAQLMAARGERGAAILQAQRALQLITGEEWPVQRVHALLVLADFSLPDVPLAETLLLEAQRITSTLALPQLSYRVRQRLGHLSLLQGRDQEAEVLLEASIMEIEQLRGTLAQESIRVSFLRDKIAPYEDLVQLYLSRADQVSLQKALHVTERAKSRSLAELVMGLVEIRLEAKPSPDAYERLQMLRAELNVVYNQALRGAQDGERAVAWHELNERAISLTNEISRLQLEFVDSQISVSPSLALSFETIQAQLSPDLTILTYHILGDEVLVFIFQNGHLHVKRSIADRSTLEELLEELEMEWTRFQAGTSFIGQHLKRLERSAQQVLANLYDYLIAPIETWLPSSSVKVPQLAIVPHGVLHEVPFQALFDGERYLIDRFELVYAPSLTLLAHYQEERPLRNKKAVIFGVSDPLIPNVVDEARSVAQHFPAAELYLNEQATWAAVRDRALHCGILHLACHGLFRADSPMFSALQLYDGWLTAADVLALDLTDTFVTLSACETGRNDGARGDEILGLTRAFLGAGARSLCVTLWLVEDEASARLMSCLYEQIAQGANYASALRTAQLAMKEKHPHPYYWAPFILIGQMSSSRQGLA